MGLWLIRLIQIAGPVLSTVLWLTSVQPAVQGYRSGNVLASLDGFYGPVALQLFGILIGLATPFVAPQWRPILAWLRSKLPDNAPTDPKSAIQQLIEAAAQEEIQNARDRLQHMTLQVTGTAPATAFVPKTVAKTALSEALTRLAAAS